jgi:hypothetical protein
VSFTGAEILFEFVEAARSGVRAKPLELAWWWRPPVAPRPAKAKAKAKAPRPLLAPRRSRPCVAVAARCSGAAEIALVELGACASARCAIASSAVVRLLGCCEHAPPLPPALMRGWAILPPRAWIVSEQCPACGGPVEHREGVSRPVHLGSSRGCRRAA